MAHAPPSNSRRRPDVRSVTQIFELAKRVKLIDQLSRLATALFLARAPFFLFSGHGKFAAFDCLIALLLALVPVLNRRGHHVISRLGGLMVFNSALLVYASLLGPSVHVGEGFYAMAAVPLLVFLPSERMQSALAILVPFVLRLMIEPLQRKLELTSYHLDPPAFLSYFTIFSRFVVLTVGIYYLRRNTTRAEAGQRRIIEELAESEERLRLALEAGQMATWDWRLDSGQVFWSHGIADFPKLARGGALRSEELLTFVHPEDRRRLKRALFRGARDGELRELDFRVVTPAGDTRWLYCRARALTTPHPRMLGIIQDLTDRKRAETKLAEQHGKLIASSKLSSLGEMAAGIAHEINNPLAIILGRSAQLTELVKRGKTEPKDLTIISEKIEATTLRISKIVRALRSFARDATQDPFERAKVQSVIEDTIEFCRERFKNHAIELRVEMPSEPIEINCRPVQIVQVLINLLNNAYDAVETEERNSRWISIAISTTEKQIEIAVADSGPGIPAAVREKLMQPFFTTKEVGKGTGLGLSVSKGIVEAHHGTLRLDVASVDTRFVITLPRPAANASTPAKSAA